MTLPEAAAQQTTPIRSPLPSSLPSWPRMSKDGNRYEGAHFVLNDSIDLSGRNWTPIGCYIWSVDGSQSAQDYFSGSLDGNDMVITGLYVDNSANQCDAGLFGAIAGGGNSPVVKDLTIEGAQILVDARQPQ